MLFVVLLVGGILGYVFNERVEDTITTTMMGELDSYSTRQSIKDAWDSAQMQVRIQMITSLGWSVKCFFFNLDQLVTSILCGIGPLQV